LPDGARENAAMKRFNWAFGVAMLAAALAHSGRAWGDAKYQRKTKEIKVEQTERTKKLEPKDQKAAAPDPTLTGDKFFSIQAALQKDYDALVNEYKSQLADLQPDDPMRLEYGFRLAEALAQQYRFYHSMAIEAQIKAERAKTPKDKSDQQALFKQN